MRTETNPAQETVVNEVKIIQPEVITISSGRQYTINNRDPLAATPKFNNPCWYNSRIIQGVAVVIFSAAVSAVLAIPVGLTLLASAGIGAALAAIGLVYVAAYNTDGDLAQKAIATRDSLTEKNNAFFTKYAEDAATLLVEFPKFVAANKLGKNAYFNELATSLSSTKEKLDTLQKELADVKDPAEDAVMEASERDSEKALNAMKRTDIEAKIELVKGQIVVAKDTFDRSFISSNLSKTEIEAIRAKLAEPAKPIVQEEVVVQEEIVAPAATTETAAPAPAPAPAAEVAA